MFLRVSKSTLLGQTKARPAQFPGWEKAHLESEGRAV